MHLHQKKCPACEGGTPPLKGEALQKLNQELDSEWKLVDEHHLERTFTFKDFQQALDFTNKVGQIAEKENHHPDIFLSWGKVQIKLFTHKIDGLSEADFIFAAKVDQL